MLVEGPFFSFSLHLELQSCSPLLIVMFYFTHCKHIKADFGCSIHRMALAIQWTWVIFFFFFFFLVFSVMYKWPTGWFAVSQWTDSSVFSVYKHIYH